MKNQRHKRKEIYSVLMVSNTDEKANSSRYPLLRFAFVLFFWLFSAL